MLIKRVLIISSGLVLALICIMIILNVRTGKDVKANINLALAQYSGSAEDALLAMLQDENRSASVRTHKAVWTLGRIRSEKALPVLRELYSNDPEGETCFGRHKSLICQYEIHKAITSIEKGRLFSHSRMNK